MVIAIDGPAGAGKSTVARAVAGALEFTYLDSGAMYRCVALASIERRAEPAQVAAEVRIELGARVLLDGRDVSVAIRTPQASEAASIVAADPAVRSAMVAEQRRLMSNAELKVYLTASPQERARRRAAELGLDPQAVLAEQTLRDQRDITRDDSPLRPAQGAVELDTTGLTLEQVVSRVVALVPGRSG